MLCPLAEGLKEHVEAGKAACPLPPSPVALAEIAQVPAGPTAPSPAGLVGWPAPGSRGPVLQSPVGCRAGGWVNADHAPSSGAVGRTELTLLGRDWVLCDGASGTCSPGCG